jgi:hypothetical protein
MQHHLDAADLLRLLPGGKLNDDLMHAALNYLCMPAGRGTCSVFSWTSKDYPIGQHVAKLLQNGVTKIVVALLDDNRHHWVGVFIDVSRSSPFLPKSSPQKNVLKASIYHSFGSSYASSLHASRVVRRALSPFPPSAPSAPVPALSSSVLSATS